MKTRKEEARRNEEMIKLEEHTKDDREETSLQILERLMKTPREEPCRSEEMVKQSENI